MARAVGLAVELIALLAVCVLALPGKRADPTEEAEALAAVRAAQRGRSAAQAPGRPGRAGRRALDAARAGRAGRAAAAGLSVVRRRAGAPENSGGTGVLTDDGDFDQNEQPDQAGHWDETDQWAEAGEWDDEPARLTGPAPSWRTGPQEAAPWEADTRQPVSPTGPQAAAMAPWETGDWGQARGSDEASEWDDAPERDRPAGGNEPGRRDEAAAEDAPARRTERAERGSHRAARHGRPGRRRGSADRSGKDGGS